MRLVAAATLLAAVLALGSARKHSLELRHEARRYFIVSSFGLLRGGTITLQVANVSFGSLFFGVGWSKGRTLN